MKLVLVRSFGSSPWPRFHSHSLWSPSGLGARWGPTDPGAASCKPGLYRIPKDIRVAKGKRAVTGDGLPIFLWSFLALDVFVVLRLLSLLPVLIVA